MTCAGRILGNIIGVCGEGVAGAVPILSRAIATSIQVLQNVINMLHQQG